MGMAVIATRDDSIRRSKTYPSCFYCPPCQATYAPNLTWGFRSHDRDSTNLLDERWTGLRKLGNECPFCGREPADV